MSAIVIGGVKFVAGLDWLPRRGALDTAREARKVGSVWCAHFGEQTGYAGSSEEHAAGMPVLAAALRAAIGGDRWMALVAGEDGRCAVVQVGDGVILGSGDRVFGSAEEAAEAIARAREPGWEVYATPGLLADAAEFHAEVLRREALLERVPFSWVTRRAVGGAGGLAAALALAMAGWGYRGQIERLWTGSVQEAVRAVEVAQEERVPVGLDPVALVEGCREAVRRFVPEMPGWRRVSLTCRARFAESELIALRPVFEGRPVMAVQWRVEAGRSESVWRQIAEKHLVRWKELAGPSLEGLVEGGKAWAAVVLPPVAVVANGAAKPSRRVLRERVDRRFGMAADDIRHDEEDGLVRIATPEPLVRIAELVGGIEGFEVTGLAWARKGWVVEGRGVSTVTMPVSKFRALRGRLQ